MVSVSENKAEGWRWVAHALPPDEVAMFSFDCVPRGALERAITRPYLPRYRAALQSALAVRGQRADLLVSHGPLMTLWAAAALQAVGAKTPQLAFGFNFTHLPAGKRLGMMRRMFQRVDRFVVPSSLERELYSNVFSLPASKFDVLLWGIEKPGVPAGAVPFISEDGAGYVCAIGGEGRDYATLFDAARQIPSIRVVCIGRPASFAGLAVPSNVSVFTNTPAETAWNVLAHSRFAIVPLRDAEVPCGHVTLVAAMHHAKALVVTDSRGVSDYVRHEENALLVPPRDATALAKAIERLWREPALAQRLGTAGSAFASVHTTEAATVRYVRAYLASLP